MEKTCFVVVTVLAVVAGGALISALLCLGFVAASGSLPGESAPRSPVIYMEEQDHRQAMQKLDEIQSKEAMCRELLQSAEIKVDMGIDK
jgi:hypothetical protein